MAEISTEECTIIKDVITDTISKELNSFKPRFAASVAKEVCTALENTGIIKHDNAEHK